MVSERCTEEHLCPHIPGNDSWKMIHPSTAVSMKFALVLITLTRTVLLANVRARVKSPHMIALKSRFIPKKNYVADIRNTVIYRLDMLGLWVIHTPRTSASTITLSSFMPKKCDQLSNCVVVVIFAKTPLRDAHAPEDMA